MRPIGRSRTGMMHERASENHHERQPVFPPVRRPRRSQPPRDGYRTRAESQMRHVLVSAGVKPAARGAAQTEKSVPGLVLYLATVRAGAVYLPLNFAYTMNELEYFIADAEPSLVVCDPSKAQGIGAIAAKVGARVETLGADGMGSLTDAAAKAEQAFATVPRGNDALAAILYTSGTTGRS